MNWQRTLDYALEYSAKTGDKVYVYGIYLITAKCWIYGWTLDKQRADSHKLDRER